jgi:hypothetical protein
MPPEALSRSDKSALQLRYFDPTEIVITNQVKLAASGFAFNIPVRGRAGGKSSRCSSLPGAQVFQLLKSSRCSSLPAAPAGHRSMPGEARFTFGSSFQFMIPTRWLGARRYCRAFSRSDERCLKKGGQLVPRYIE